jgi:alpha-L-rhamnosidase
MKPSHLTCEALTTPLGMDERTPQMSWRLNDSRRGVRQSAFQIQVATSPSLLASDKPNVWDSGRIASNQSVGVRYGGPEMIASKRYYWRVKVWDGDGKPYPPSDASWWETGLLNSSRWADAKWISYEEDEHRSIRDVHPEWITTPESDFAVSDNSDAHFYFRYKFELPADARRAKLHITGEDTVGVWINGRQQVQHQPLPAWKTLPWRTYVPMSLLRMSCAMKPAARSVRLSARCYTSKPWMANS